MTIIVTACSNHYHACVADDRTLEAVGLYPEGAIGKLIIEHGAALGIKLERLQGWKVLFSSGIEVKGWDGP